MLSCVVTLRLQPRQTLLRHRSFAEFCTSAQKSEAHPLSFQSSPHSLQKHPGVTTSARSDSQALLQLTPRNRLWDTVHALRPVTTFILNTCKKPGEGRCYVN